MIRFRAYIAVLLLLLFCRVMLPEAAVLSLHRHTHTEHEHAKNISVEKAHTHCHVDELYDGSFQASLHTFEQTVLRKYSGYYGSPYNLAWKFTFPHNTFLRGPPQA